MKSAFSQNPILVIDRNGLIGEPLSLKLSKEFPVVFVSRSPAANIPFSGKFPVVPDNKYSHIIFIDEEGRDLELLSKIIDKVRDINADFIVALGLSARGEYAIDKIIRSCPSAKIAIFGDIFDNKLILKKENFKSVVNKFIYQAQKFGKMQVLGDGLRDAYPVFLNDVVDGLIELVFRMHKSHSLFYIFPEHPPTELSLAHMIQKANPEVMLDFVKHDPRLERVVYPPKGKYLLGNKYQLAQKIRKIDIGKKVGIGSENLHGKTKRLKSFPFFAFWILILLLLSPFFFTEFFLFLGKNTFYYAKGEIDRGNFVNAKSSLHLSKTFFYAGKQTLNILSFQAKAVGQVDKLSNLLENINFGYKMSDTLSQIFSFGDYISKILNGKSENSVDDFAKAQSYLKSSIIALCGAKAEGKIPAPISQNLERASPLIKFLSNTVDIMPNIFGMEMPKTYLILLQDNMELRPGGGVISSYGILKFNKGKITQFTMSDVYDADSQLRGHVEPPFAVRRYLSEEHWYFRDSNFDVDFVKSALSASNFLFIETGQKADGVIAIDASFIKNILHATGPIYVADYRENVNENNFYALAQSYVDKNPLPGSTQKKDFLRSVSEAIIKEMTGEKVPYLLVAQAISDGLLQKHLLFTFKDEQNIFTVNGWSSSLWDERNNSEDSINDFIGINEANMGMNKVNNFIKRQVFQKVVIGEGGNIAEELTINYKNESKTWPGGDYKNYLRIILPKNTQLSKISINDKSQDAKDVIEKTQEGEKTVYGFIVNVPAGENVKVKIEYALPGSILGLNIFSYNLKFFKQPGIDNIPYSLSIAYPKSFSIVKGSEGISGREGEASYSEKIINDKDLIINFSKILAN